jgi:DMSO/TMAO reductase YedYZ molybdopterin-dependent catalytic subunit
VPTNPVIEIRRAVGEPFRVPSAELAVLPRRELIADFHCVAGWSATGLRWEGVAFGSFYSQIFEPRLLPGAPVTHVVFGGLDGYRWTALFADAVGEDVLIADRLDGRPLDADHGAPARIVSPNQYGYASVKHLARIELLTSEPPENYGAPQFTELVLRSPLIKPHRRARVWNEERHRYLPGRALRAPYRLLIPPIRLLSARRAPRKR